MEVANESLVAAAGQLTDIFGPVDVRVAETRIAGIDIVVLLGTDYLDTLDTATASETSAAVDGTADTVGAATTPAEGTS